MSTTPEFLPRKPHGQRSLADYSPRGRKESDRTERPSLALRGTQHSQGLWDKEGPCPLGNMDPQMLTGMSAPVILHSRACSSAERSHRKSL